MSGFGIMDRFDFVTAAAGNASDPRSAATRFDVNTGADNLYFEDSVRTASSLVARGVAPVVGVSEETAQEAGYYNEGYGKDHWSVLASQAASLMETDGIGYI